MTGARLIEIPTWGTVTMIEAIWLATGIVTLLVTAPHLPPLVRELRSIETGRPVLYRLHRGYVRREVGRMLQGAVICAIGVYAATQGSVVNGTTWTGLAITVGFLLIASAAGLMSWWDWRDREIVQRDIERGLNGHHRPAGEGSFGGPAIEGSSSE